MKAHFKCMNDKCGWEYKDKPGPTQCPFCGSIYVEWVNYKEWYDTQKKSGN